MCNESLERTHQASVVVLLLGAHKEGCPAQWGTNFPMWACVLSCYTVLGRMEGGVYLQM